MKKFLLQILLFSLLVGGSIFIIFSLADGNSDAYYLRFATPQQESMIIGASRAAQGLQPEVFNKLFSEAGKHNSFFNFSFSIGQSPYGPVFLYSIKKKINPNTKDGVYIVCVEPWSISNKDSNLNDSTNFGELNRELGKTNFVNLSPNLFYLINSFDQPYFNIIKGKITKPAMSLHSDGWLEVTVPMDSASVNERMEKRLADYRTNYIPFYTFSETRFNYLLKTIDFLQTHGKVYLVRLPVSAKWLPIDNNLMPTFDSLMNSVCVQKKVDYFNFKDSMNYQYVEGNHLYKASGKKVSEVIAKRILKKR